MSASPLTERIEAIVAPALADLGYRLVRVRLTGARSRTLQIMIERLDEDAVGVEDCARASETVSALLDVEDPLAGGYALELSSPGIDRPLVRPQDFERYAGFEARIETRRPIDGRRRFRGRLRPAREGQVRIALAEGDVEFSFDDVAEAKLVLTDELIAQAAQTQDRL